MIVRSESCVLRPAADSNIFYPGMSVAAIAFITKQYSIVRYLIQQIIWTAFFNSCKYKYRTNNMDCPFGCKRNKTIQSLWFEWTKVIMKLYINNNSLLLCLNKIQSDETIKIISKISYLKKNVINLIHIGVLLILALSASDMIKVITMYVEHTSSSIYKEVCKDHIVVAQERRVSVIVRDITRPHKSSQRTPSK